ncbi:MFS transporter [Glutamicibacter sp.]|uniref:MFS transporter n=1 Tax=Glutamicibacter sp. TaxID=1931995 RepID=UPI003D6A9ADB
MRRVLLSSYLGSVVEFYDFLVYGTAASLVFGHLFFANLSPILGTVAAFGTMAVGYVARPLGGIIFGHFGDRLGRKKMLVLTMILMGSASTLIGLLPTQAQIGVLAPLLLIALRLVQGLAIGGEWGGATLMALEHSRSQKRGLSVGIVNAGAPTGAVLAASIMGLFAMLPEAQFMAWGWRIPFLLSAVLVVVALWVRLGVHESPAFAKVQEQVKDQRKSPLAEVLREPKTLVQTVLAGATPTAIQSMLATFALTIAVQGGADRSTALFIAAIASVVNMFTLPCFAAMSDKVGRRPMLLAGLFIGAVLFYPVFSMIGSGETGKMFAGYVVGYGLIVGILMGIISPFISEQFSTGSRYTGASIGYQLGATLGGGFAPMIAAQLLVFGGGTSLKYVVVFFVALSIISAIAVYTTRETSKSELS